MQDGHTILRRLMIGSGLRFLLFFVQAAVLFFMTPLMIRVLGKEDYGIWLLVFLVVGTFALLELGLNTAVARFISAAVGRGEPEEINRIFNTGFFLFIVIALLVFLLTVSASFFTVEAVRLVKPEAQIGNVAVFRVMLFLIGTQFALELPLRAFNGLLAGFMRHDTAALLKILFMLLTNFLMFLVLWNGPALLPYCGNLLIPLAAIYPLLSFLTGFIWYAAAKRVFPALRISPFLITRESLHQVFRYTSISVVAMIADIFKSPLPGFVLGSLLGLAAIAYYGVLSTLSAPLAQIVQQITNVTSPLFARLISRDDHDAVRKALAFSIKVAVVVSTFIAFGLIAWSRPFIPIWMSDSFMETLGMPYDTLLLTLWLIVLSLWIDKAQSPCTELLYGTSNHHYYSAVNAVETGLMFVFSLVGVHLYGFPGIGIGLLAPVVLTRGLLLPLAVCRVGNMSPSVYYRMLLQPTFGSLLACLGPSIATYCLVGAQATLARLFLVGVLSTLLYLPAAAFLVFTPWEREKMWTALWKTA